MTNKDILISDLNDISEILNNNGYGGWCATIRKAVALLKEQEAELLTFDEVKKHFLVPKELFGSIEKYIDYANDIEPLYMECLYEDAFVCHWRTHENISMHIDDWKNEYGKTWRCWTKKPTQGQMKAMKWE